GMEVFFVFQAEDGIRDWSVTGVQTCALPILILGSIRLVLGVVGLAAAAAIGHSLGTALAAGAVGVVLTIFTLISPGGRRRPAQLRPPSPRRAPQSGWRALAAAMFPSTYGVALLTGIALAFNADLAAFLSGVMLGMGLTALAYALPRLKVRP